MKPRIIDGEEVRVKFADSGLQIQEFFSDPQTRLRVVSIAKDLALPESVQSVIGKEVGYAILGLRKPDETVTAFIEAGATENLSRQIVGRIAKDILSLVPGTPISLPKEPAPTLGKQQPSYVPLDHQLEDGHHDKREVPALKPTPTPAPVVPPQPKPQPVPVVPSRPAPSPDLSAAIQEAIRPRTMASDVEALQTPKPKAPETHQAKQVPQPQVRTAPVASKPISVPPPPNTATIHEDLKKYGVDPYREPIE